MGTSEAVLGMAGATDTELHPSRHLADVELQGVVVLPYKTQGVSYYFSRKGRFKSFSGKHYSTGEFSSTFTPLLIVYL